MLKLGRWLLGLSLIISLLLALSLSHQISEAEAPTTILSQLETKEYLTVQDINECIDIMCGKYNFPYFSLMKELAFKESSSGQNKKCGDGGLSCGLFQFRIQTWKEFQIEFNRSDLQYKNDIDQIEMTILALRNGYWYRWGPLLKRYNVNPIK